MSRISDTTAADYHAMTVKELKGLCKARGVAGYSRFKKAQLVAALLKPADPDSEAPEADAKGASGADIGDSLSAASASGEGPGTAEVAAEVAAAVAAAAEAEETDPEAEAAPSAVEASQAAETVETAETAETAEVAASREDSAVPPDPAGVFIDYGPLLPELLPERRVRVMLRDPGRAYVYWQGEPPVGAQAWRVDALGLGGVVLQQFEVGLQQRSGWIQAPVTSIREVRVSSRMGDGRFVPLPTAPMNSSPESPRGAMAALASAAESLNPGERIDETPAGAPESGGAWPGTPSSPGRRTSGARRSSSIFQGHPAAPAAGLS